MSGKDLPQEVCPFEKDITDVESVQDPRPLITVQMKGFVGTRSFGIADVSSVQVRKNVQTTHNGQDTTIELGHSYQSLCTRSRCCIAYLFSDVGSSVGRDCYMSWGEAARLCFFDHFNVGLVGLVDVVDLSHLRR